jgi:putative transposase
MFLHFTQLPQHSRLLALATDLTRPKVELVLENALLRQQLGILRRQFNKPRFTRTDRLSLLLLTSLLPNWKQALLILKPDTLLHWHRQGFKLFWRFKIRTRRWVHGT